MRYRNIFTKQSDIQTIKEACGISVNILRTLMENVKVGVNSLDINDLAGQLCDKFNVRPSFLGVPGPYGPFPASLCVVVNDEIIHAIPQDYVFQNGDVIKLDFGIIFRGFCTDHCVSIGLGEITSGQQRLLETNKLSIEAGIQQAKVGNRIGDISNALQTVTELSGFRSVVGFGGHGIGKSIHMDPHISFYGLKGTGPKIEEGMLLCIENWVPEIPSQVYTLEDGWTLKTENGSVSACFEHMVYVTSKGPQVLTRL